MLSKTNRLRDLCVTLFNLTIRTGWVRIVSCYLQKDRMVMRYFLAILLFSLTCTVSATEKEEIEKSIKIANHQARCMGAILDTFQSKEEERIAYSKFYTVLVKHHKSFIDHTLKHKESGMPEILKYVGSVDILVGMVMQGTIARADEYNSKYDKERTGKSLAEFNRFLWDVNGCDAIYSSI